jgi:hypothetical protein
VDLALRRYTHSRLRTQRQFLDSNFLSAEPASEAFAFGLKCSALNLLVKPSEFMLYGVYEEAAPRGRCRSGPARQTGKPATSPGQGCPKLIEAKPCLKVGGQAPILLDCSKMLVPSEASLAGLAALPSCGIVSRQEPIDASK